MRELEFPVGRALNLLFRPTSETDEEKQLWTSALGEYAAQQTHSLKTTSLRQA